MKKTYTLSYDYELKRYGKHIEDLIEEITKKKDELISHCPNADIIGYTLNTYYEDGTCLEIHYNREETDEEYNSRLKSEALEEKRKKQNKKAKEQKELELYQKLKKKYEK
jgi:hypothetical protein